VLSYKPEEDARMTDQYEPVSPLFAALTACCPRCGQGRLFKNVLELRPECECCALDFKFIDTGDGPAIFVIFILGFLALGGALLLHLGYGVALWKTYVSVGVLTPLIALALLRFLKAFLTALQYRHKAEEGRLAEE
jgi:uncharacterized protein (DUF983 family)